MKATNSVYILVNKSKIHNDGVFAKKNIPKGTKIIEYVGEKITKAESDKRAKIVLDKYKGNNTAFGGVYIFESDSKFDIDGNVGYNTAKLINHSCDPNCEAINENGHIWIYSKANIKKGKELNYDYGYSLDNWSEHPCKCGSKRCVKYIVAENLRLKLKFIKLWENIKIFSGMEKKK